MLLFDGQQIRVKIMNDYKLDEIAKSYAKDIIAEVKEYGGDAYDLAHEMIDGSEHVIYYANAHAICHLPELRHLKRRNVSRRCRPA